MSDSVRARNIFEGIQIFFKKQNNTVLKDTDSGIKVPVGHRPAMEPWTSWLSSLSLSVLTGAMGSVTPH